MVKLMKVPKSIFRQTGDEKIHVENLMEKFFVNTKKYVQSKLKGDEDHYFKIKSASFSYGSRQVNSDNIVTYVEFRERYIIAGIFETRTAFNDLQFTFFRDLSCLEKPISQ